VHGDEAGLAGLGFDHDLGDEHGLPLFFFSEIPRGIGATHPPGTQRRE
jgi:hypothetical protein